MNHFPDGVDLDDVETVREAAIRVGVSEKTVRQWMRRHPAELPAVMPSFRPIFVFAADVDRCATARNSVRTRARRRARNRFLASEDSAL